MRQHIGQHIVLKHVDEHQKRCDFCQNIGYNISLVDGSGAGQSKNLKAFLYDCKFFVDINLKAAVKCDACQCVYWSYNLRKHYSGNHKNVSFTEDKDISASEISSLKKLEIYN